MLGRLLWNGALEVSRIRILTVITTMLPRSFGFVIVGFGAQGAKVFVGKRYVTVHVLGSMKERAYHTVCAVSFQGQIVFIGGVDWLR